MSFLQAQARLQAAVFDRLGEAATWDGVSDSVRVIRRVADEQLRFDQATIIQTGVTLRVRKSEVAAPAEGQEVQVLDEDGNPAADGLFVLNGVPELDRKGVWHCPAKQG